MTRMSCRSSAPSVVGGQLVEEVTAALGSWPDARRVKAGGLRGMPRAGLNARNLLRAGTEGHGRAMATTNSDAFVAEGAEAIHQIGSKPHLCGVPEAS